MPRGSGVGAGELNAPLVAVDAGDVRHQALEAAGERTRAAADIERLFAARGNGVEDHPVVVEVMAPRLRRSGPSRSCRAQPLCHAVNSAAWRRLGSAMASAVTAPRSESAAATARAGRKPSVTLAGDPRCP